MAQNANENNVLPNKTKVDHYIIESHIGHGGYGEIYSVYDENHKGPWAMKVEMKSAKKHGLTEEIHYLKMLRGSPMFPEYICNGETNELKYFIMELLGPSVSFVRRSLPDLRYSQLTATILAKEMLKCIEELHKRGYVHRDIKPGNFLIRPNRHNPIVLIDFGLSRRYADRDTMKPLPPRHNPGFIGTCSFASLNAHEGKELGRRDDIFSWIYTVIEMVDKRLPWPGSKDREKTYRLKQHIRPYDLCHSLPRAFTTIYLKTIGYQFEDKPDYQGFYKLLDKAIQDLGGYGKPFDWEKLPPETISRISAIPLDMGPLSVSEESDDKDNNKNESQEEMKENNRKTSKTKKMSSIDQNNKNEENQQKPKNQREKAATNESKNQNNQESNNQRKKTKKKSNSNANTTYATNETNTSNKKQAVNISSKQEETVPESDKKDHRDDDDDKSSDSHKQLRTAPPRDEPKVTKKVKRVKKTVNSNRDESQSNSRLDSDPKANNNNNNSNNSDNKNSSEKDSDDSSRSNSDSESESQKQQQQQQQQQQAKPQTTQVTTKSVNSNNNEANIEEPDINRNKAKKKNKGKADHEPGCKACLIA